MNICLVDPLPQAAAAEAQEKERLLAAAQAELAAARRDADARLAELQRDLAAAHAAAQSAAREAKEQGASELAAARHALDDALAEKAAMGAEVAAMTAQIEAQFEEEVGGWRRRLEAAQGARLGTALQLHCNFIDRPCNTNKDNCGATYLALYRHTQRCVYMTVQ